MSQELDVEILDPNFRFEGKKLLIPAVGCANVDQLALDFVISSFSLRCVAVLHSEDLIPVAGYAEDAQDDGIERILSTAEFFAGADLPDVVILQLRAPAIPKRESSFVGSFLNACASKLGISDVLLLSGVNSAWRNDDQLMISSPFRYISFAKDGKSWFSQVESRFAHRVSLENRHQIAPLELGDNTDTILESSPLLNEFRKASNADSTDACKWTPQQFDVLLMFCAEGNNTFHAIEFAQSLAAVGVIPVPKSGKWKAPKSWSFLFGSSFDPSLFT
eukprot:ANDGO_07959.mRNA.1 Proteasome assembly chaperone 2